MHNTLLISFLDQLRRTDKKVFVFATLFIFAQLFLTFIKLELTPFFLYGMYSENMIATDTFLTLHITVNNRSIDDYGSPLRERYMLEETAANYISMKENDFTDPLKTRIESRYPFIYHSGIYPLVEKKIYNSKQSMDGYKIWLKRKCLDIARLQSGSVKIVRTISVLNKETLQLNPVKNEVLEDL